MTEYALVPILLIAAGWVVNKVKKKREQQKTLEAMYEETLLREANPEYAAAMDDLWSEAIKRKMKEAEAGK